MKIMVFDVPAESGGALTILNQYYEMAVQDKENEYYFVLSILDFPETENVKVLKFPFVKKSWFHRLYFDYFIAYKLAHDYNIEEIISLQNTIISGTNVPQTLYLHTVLPFSNIKFKMWEYPVFWVYQNIISKIIRKSIKKADKVIVQTKWMQNLCIRETKERPEKFVVETPTLVNEIKGKYKEKNKEKNKDIVTFFYPAGAHVYKNHELIVKAVAHMCDSGIKNFQVIFTLVGDENKVTKKISEEIYDKKLPIKLIGYTPIEKVYEYYQESILIFPSYIETFGLPLLEAKVHETPILASDCEFSREILNDYDKVKFFNPFDSHDLASKIVSML